MKKDKPLTAAQKKACEMLYYCRRVSDVASTVGVHRSTIWRWRQLSSFRKEWRRIDHNADRRFKRRMAKKRAEQDAYWTLQEDEAEKNLYEKASKAKGKPGKALDNAWNLYVKALCRGRPLSQLLEDVMSDKPKRCKASGAKATRNKTGEKRRTWGGSHVAPRS